MIPEDVCKNCKQYMMYLNSRHIYICPDCDEDALQNHLSGKWREETASDEMPWDTWEEYRGEK